MENDSLPRIGKMYRIDRRDARRRLEPNRQLTRWAVSRPEEENRQSTQVLLRQL
jgi:hypothetical protein